MRPIGNLKWVAAAVIAVTISAAIGVAAWRSSGGSEGSGAMPDPGMQMEGSPEGPKHEHK